MPSNVRRVASWGPPYNFGALKHGDAIEVESKPGAQEMFRRWKKTKGRKGRLVPSRDYANILFFLDDDAGV